MTPPDRAPEPLNATGAASSTDIGLIWYSPCGYQRRDLFVTSAPIPHCPQCGAMAWSTIPPPLDAARDSRPVGEGLREAAADVVRRWVDFNDAEWETATKDVAGVALQSSVAALYASLAAVRPVDPPPGYAEFKRGGLQRARELQADLAVRPVELDVVGLAVAMNTAQITPEEIRPGHDLRIPASRIAQAYGRPRSALAALRQSMETFAAARERDVRDNRDAPDNINESVAAVVRGWIARLDQQP